ncbi:MAG: hypothetical protein NT053_11155 [Cyanobacteria bacterium]|nr:hypothetical protein [Cyanobacteriota bacterium]
MPPSKVLADSRAVPTRGNIEPAIAQRDNSIVVTNDDELENPKMLTLFLDFMLKTDLGQEGGLVPLTSSRFQRLSRLVEGVVIDD